MLISEGFYYVIVNLNMFITRCSYTDYATVLNSYNLWTQHCTDSKKTKLLGFLDTSVYVEAQQHQCKLVYFKNKQTNKKPTQGDTFRVQSGFAFIPEMKWVLQSRLPSFGTQPSRFTAAIQRCFLSGSRGKR